VVEAENGDIAIQKLNADDFDVILMDIHMPIMDGVTATREIRGGNTKTRDIPIIGVTASVMKDEKEHYLRAGMNAVVAKPIEMGKLIEIIRRII